MKNLALPRIQAMQAYSPPLEGRSNYDGSLLDFNEGTIPPPIDLRGLAGRIRPEIYPEYSDLPARIAEYAGVDAEEVMITNGTDKAIDAIFRTFADVNERVIIPEPSFAMFGLAAMIAGNQIVKPRYDPDIRAFPTRAIVEAIDESTKLITICNPNNPTGTLAAPEEIEEIAEAASHAAVYVDEAYYEFSGQTAVPLIDKHPNIMVSRTFSKAFRLAGLRIGYIVAKQLHINEMLKVRGPYDVNQVAVEAAVAVLSETEAVSAYTAEVMDKAKPIVEQYFEDNGIDFWPSAANFILFKPDRPAWVAHVLKQNGILLRPQQKKPLIEDTLRVTIGTVPDMRRFIKIYDRVVQNADL